jgi:outer membrane protein
MPRPIKQKVCHCSIAIGPLVYEQHAVSRLRRNVTLCFALLVLIAIHANTQTAAPNSSSGQAMSPANAPLTITFSDALQRARSNSLEFRSATVDVALAHQDKVQARAGMLPNATYAAQYLYTQGNGTASGRFIANNGVHEYLSEGNVHQEINLGLSEVTAYRRASAAEAMAKAKAEIAARGLVVTVVDTYYGLIVAERKYATSQAATAEAQHFLDIIQKLEGGGEVAHSDLIKAQIQFNDRQRELQDAQLNMGKARLALAVLLSPNFNEDFTIVDDMSSPPTLPTREEVQQMAGKNNPSLRAALAGIDISKREVTIARAGYLPTLGFDYWYGIDSNHFAVNGFDSITHNKFRNLGYAASATLNIPIWNWGSTQSKIKQAELKRSLAQLELTTAQKRLLSNVQTSYGEAVTAQQQIDVLRQSADLADQSLRLTNARYSAGEATVLEVVDAQNTLTTARNALADGESRYRVAIADLQTLTGNF